MSNTPKIIGSVLQAKASVTLEDSVKKDLESDIDEEKAFASLQKERETVEKPNS